MSERLMRATLEISPSKFTPQGVAVISRAFLGQYGSECDHSDPRRGVVGALKQRLSVIAQGLPPRDYTLQSVALIASAFGSSKPHERDIADLFRFLAQVVSTASSQSPDNSPRTIAHIMWGFAQVNVEVPKP